MSCSPSQPNAAPPESGAGSPAQEKVPSGEHDLLADLRDLLAPPQGPGELGWLAHYRVLRVLGQGGMGAVLQAEDTHLQRPVALKIILPDVAGSTAARERFLREARAAAALHNDHVVTVYQVSQDRDVPFLAMELLQGRTLEDGLSDGPDPALGEVVRIGQEVAEGLAAAHARGLIHRDIKPANLWLEAPSGRVKILDFGLARPVQGPSHLTGTGFIVGTPEFMSPEQARGLPLDARSDLFNLGIVLYRLCTGRLPFQGHNVTAILMALAVDPPSPVRDLNPAVPPALADLVMRLLEKNPARRPASAGEVVTALRAVEAQLPPASEAAAAGARTACPVPTEVVRASAAGVTGAPAVNPVRPGLAPTVIPSLTAPVRRPLWRRGTVALGALLVAGGLVFLAVKGFRVHPGGNRDPALAAPTGTPIRVGVLHSRTGTMAISERPVIDAVLLAVDELNEQGGVLGRPVEAVVADGQSDEAVFARQAEKLIEQDRVVTIFGCWTSASRKAVKPVVERHDHLLLYPVQYEGMELSPNIVYGGPVPNQQILPALKWGFAFLNKRRWFLVSSDYIFPHAANAVIRDEAKSLGSQIVGEEYLLLGSTETAGVVRKIVESKPDLILNTINGDTNVAFFRALRRPGVMPERVPALSFSISEQELSSLAPREVNGDYTAGSYFESITLPQNEAFLRRFQARYGAERAVSDPMQTAYYSVFLWAQAVRAAGRTDVRAVREAIKGQRFDAPQGPVQIDSATLHTVQQVRIGRVNAAGRLEEVFVSPRPLAPEPFPASRSRAEWEAFLEGWYRRWGGHWANPGP